MLIEEVNEDTYQLKKSHDVAPPQFVHMNRLKAYYSTEAILNMICCVEGGN